MLKALLPVFAMTAILFGIPAAAAERQPTNQTTQSSGAASSQPSQPTQTSSPGKDSTSAGQPQTADDKSKPKKPNLYTATSKGVHIPQVTTH